MAATLAQLRAGLAANLTVLVSAYPELQVSGYMLANPAPPAIHVFPGGPADAIEYDLAMGRGLDRWSFTVQAFVPLSGTDTNSQQMLDLFMAPAGSQSVKAALEADTTLGGAANGLQVVGCSGYRVYVREGGPSVLGAEWSVDVFVRGF